MMPRHKPEHCAYSSSLVVIALLAATAVAQSAIVALIALIAISTVTLLLAVRTLLLLPVIIKVNDLMPALPPRCLLALQVNKWHRA
jgi:hypothetical protein